MASNIKNFLKGNRTKHTVGSWTSFIAPVTFTNGAIVAEEGGVDNFCLVEMSYNDGIAEIKYATTSATKDNVFLTMSHEDVLDEYGEYLCDFYNEKGERAVIAYLPTGRTFDTSNYTDAENAKKGDFVVWDAATKKFIKKAVPEASDVKVFQVIDVETDEKYSIDNTILVNLVVVR